MDAVIDNRLNSPGQVARCTSQPEYTDHMLLTTSSNRPNYL